MKVAPTEEAESFKLYLRSPRNRSEKVTMNVLVDDRELREMGKRPALGEYIRAVRVRREFIWLDARARAFQTDREMILGRVWLVLSPILDALMYGLIFGIILKTSRGIDNFIGYLIVGIVFFGMMRGALTGGIDLTRSFRKMIGSFNLPAAALIISRNLREALDSIIPAVVAIVIALAFQWGEPINWTLILVVPVWVLIQFFGLGLMFISARLTAEIPDLKTAITLFARAWFFVSGVFFSIERFVNNPELQAVMLHNPAYRFLTAIRGAAMYGEAPSLGDWSFLLVWAFGTLIFGFIFFWMGEGKYANVR